MILFLLKNENWASITIIAAIISQILIFSVWQDAKSGTIVNILALTVAMSDWASLNDTQIVPLVYLSGVLLFVAGISIVRGHNI